MDSRVLLTQLLVALLVAVVGATVIASVAGARRTVTAFDRFLDESRSPDSFLTYASGDESLSEDQLHAIESLPEVDGSARLVALAAMVEEAGDSYVPVLGSLDAGYGSAVARPRIVEGRSANPDAAGEITLSEIRADALGVGVGSRLHVASFSPDQAAQMALSEEAEVGEPAGPRVELEVVGIHRLPVQLATTDETVDFTVVTPAFVREHFDEIGDFGRILLVDVRGGSDGADDFMSHAQRLDGLDELAFEGGGSNGEDPVNATLRFMGSALLVFASIAALAGVASVAFVVVRAAGRRADEIATLRQLGLSRRSASGALAASFAPGLVAGSLGAIALAIVVSQFLPFGLAGRAEPDPGMSVDLVVLGAGLVISTMVWTGVALGAGVWAGSTKRTRGARPNPRPGPLARRAVLAMSPAGLTGVRFAFGRGSTAARFGPARVAMLAVGLGLGGVVASLVFSTSLTAAEDEPESWGGSWDFQLSDAALPHLDRDAVSDLSFVRKATVEIGGIPVEVRGIDAIEGRAHGVLLEGHRPAEGEVVLGAKILDRLGVSIGDEVEASSEGRVGAARRRRYRRLHRGGRRAGAG